MNRHRWWDLRAEAGGGEGGGGGGGGGGNGNGGGVEPAQAREFLTGFVPDPKVLEGMPDDQVIAWHGSVNKQLTAAQQKAADEALAKQDWRKSIAGDNADAMKTLERFASPKALYESYDQFRTRMSKGELKAVTAFPDKGSDEEKARWRAENGVPAEPKGYEIKLAEGLTMTDDDKPIMESFTKYAHERNLPAGYVNEAANWFFTERAAKQEQAAAVVEQKKRDTAAELGAEWGTDYKPNLNKIEGLLDSTIPGDQADLKDSIKAAIATNPHFARHYAQLARELNPTGSMVPGDRGATETSVADELRKLDALMLTDRAAYNKQEGRYRELVAGYQKLTGKEWGR